MCTGGATPCGSACALLQSDGNNCNACGRSCLGGTCSGGVCQPVLFVPASLFGGGVQDFASDGNVVVWADGDGTIDEVASVGATSKIVLGTGFSNMRALTMSGSSVAAIRFDGTSTFVIHATAGSAGSGAQPALASFTGVSNGLVFDPGGATVYTEALSGLKACIVATGTCSQLGATVSSSNIGQDIAIGGGYIVWADNTSGTVRKTSTSGGAAATTYSVTGIGTVNHVAADGSYAYWLQQNTSPNFMHRDLFTETSSDMSINVGNVGGYLATDGTYLYFTVGTDIVYMPVAGGTISTLAAGVGAGTLKLFAGALYYVAAGGIYRLKTP
jgi:hypothetical protein